MNRELVKAVAASRRRDEIVSPLVIYPDGELFPFTYGMPAAWSFGSASSDQARASASGWRDRVSSLLDHAYVEAEKLDWPFFNWFEHLIKVASIHEFSFSFDNFSP